MLNLVAYDASDSEQESDSYESDENCIRAEVVRHPKKGVNIVEKREAVDEDCPEVNVHKEVSDSVADTLESASSGGWSVLDCLPSAAPIHSAKTIDSESLGDNELEELVKRKQWEIKLAKKAEKERRKKEKKLKKRGVKKRMKALENVDGDEKRNKKKAKIDAFGGLVGLEQYSDDDHDDVEKRKEKANKAINYKNGLLSALPQPKSKSRIESKGANVLLPNSVRARKKIKQQEVTATKSSVMVEEESDESDVDSSDFFGLHSASTVPQLPVNYKPLARISDVNYGPSRPSDRLSQPSSLTQTNDYDEQLSNQVEGPSTSGIIDNSKAQEMIYTNDIALWGGSEANAAEAISGIVDVSVDQVLGPNVQANLLKNLHNKSLAEAAISHLAAIPKSKGPKDMVARRKHQITYLATMAVAREEQLAEQWSQNRHMKRVSAQKYGF